jgi:hypothetical protein
MRSSIAKVRAAMAGRQAGFVARSQPISGASAARQPRLSVLAAARQPVPELDIDHDLGWPERALATLDC